MILISPPRFMMQKETEEEVKSQQTLCCCRYSLSLSLLSDLISKPCLENGGAADNEQSIQVKWIGRKGRRERRVNEGTSASLQCSGMNCQHAMSNSALASFCWIHRAGPAAERK